MNRIHSQTGRSAPPRSFVRRSGRITRAQKRALEELWPAYGLDETTEPIVLERVFGRRAPTILEIGFGNGETLVRAAAEAPQCNFLGVEVHLPGLGRCLLASRARRAFQPAPDSGRCHGRAALAVVAGRPGDGVPVFPRSLAAQTPSQASAGATGLYCAACAGAGTRRRVPCGHGLVAVRRAHRSRDGFSGGVRAAGRGACPLRHAI